MHHVFRQAQLQTQLAHFVLEQLAQRLQELEFHVLRQAADIVVRLDDMRLAGLAARRFDHVRIDRALGQPLDVLELGRFLIEDFDEHAADDLALLFRIRLAGQGGQEALLRIDANHPHAHVLAQTSPSPDRLRPGAASP